MGVCWRRESLVSRWCRSSCLRTFLTQRRALMIADNRIADNAGWDDEVLAAELATLRDEDVDLELRGFDKADLDRTARRVGT